MSNQPITGGKSTKIFTVYHFKLFCVKNSDDMVIGLSWIRVYGSEKHLATIYDKNRSTFIFYVYCLNNYLFHLSKVGNVL